MFYSPFCKLSNGTPEHAANVFDVMLERRKISGAALDIVFTTSQGAMGVSHFFKVSSSGRDTLPVAVDPSFIYVSVPGLIVV